MWTIDLPRRIWVMGWDLAQPRFSPPNITALHLGTLLEPSLVHRQGVRQPTAAQHQITHQFYKYILYPEYHPQFVAPAINQATDTFLTSIPSPDTLLTFTP